VRAFVCNQVRSAATRFAAVVLLMGLVLGLDAFAVSSRLHLKLCPDANRPGHHCAVQTFAGGVAGVSLEPLLVLAILVVVLGAMHVQGILLPSLPVFRLSPCRAPPASARFRG
jgi:hypothetical protein